MLDVVELSRLQFAVTTIYHWLFVPVTLGMTVIIALMETVYVRTKNEMYKKMAKYWGGLFLINFVMGVVTGIVQEFHFGMNWSEYSRFMGDIFGAPLALEALTAFFMESTFMGAWIFGWDRLSPKAHAVTAWLVAIGSNLSAFWILVANSFMQNPVGFEIVNGRAEMVSFGALVSNKYIHTQFSHIFTDALFTGGCIIAAVSAWYLLKNRGEHTEFYKKSITWGLGFMMLGGLLVQGVGHLTGQQITKVQPMKMAAIEALWETHQSAPFTIAAVIDEKAQTTTGLEVPGGLSFLIHDSFQGEVKGIKELQALAEAKYGPGDYIPAVTPMFWAFRIMVFTGMIMFGVAVLGYFFLRRGQLLENNKLLTLIFWTLPLPFLANSTGWFVAEAGRQPWIVYGLQKTADGVSKAITVGEVWISLIGFTIVYIIAIVIALYLAVKHVKAGPDGNHSHDVVEVKKEATLWN